MRSKLADTPDAGVTHPAARRWLRRHALAYAAVIGLLTAINLIGGAPWWAFWPSAGWGVALLVHYMVVKSMTIDDAWVDARAGKVRDKSYDIGHIRDIEQRIIDGDASLDPPIDRRDRERDRS